MTPRLIFRLIYRVFLFIVIIGSFMIWSSLCFLVIRNSKSRKIQASKNITFYCKAILFFFNIKVKMLNECPSKNPFLYVSNHMGFIDIFVSASLGPKLFVTSQEMADTPFLGTITDMGGCIYVERRSRTQILGEVQNIVNALKDGFSVTLYPEATSTNGEQVLPFKRTLLTAAAHAGVAIQPAVINFNKINGEPFTLKWRDYVCWYGDMSFATVLFRALQLADLEVEVKYLEPIFPSLEDDRAEVAARAHSAIAQEFRPVQRQA